MIRTMINSNFTDVNVLFLFLILWMSGCEKNTSAEVDTDPPQETEFEYDILQLGEIPIGLWVTPPPSFQNHEEYRNIKESGINFIKDRKSTRLNSSHVAISYAVFCLKKKKLNIVKS